MEFNPSNPIIKLCLRGMEMDAKGKPEEAYVLFLEAWNSASNDFEKFTAAYYVARYQQTVIDTLEWYETALQLASKINNVSVNGAFPALYLNISKCYEELGDAKNAKKHHDLAISFGNKPTDTGPFYHGTKAALQVGDLLTAGGLSNYQSSLTMNHIYFTALVNGAGLAAALAKGDGEEHVYIVEPTGSFENDPNVTDKKFPGNPTRSYRSIAPLKIVGEAHDWIKQTPEELAQWRQKLAQNKGDIIN
jgi:tetratricopeptide (TPR) repeat protein